MIKVTALAGSAVMLAPNIGLAQATSHPTGGFFDPPSPPVTEFAAKLPIMPVKKALLGGANGLSRPENGGVKPNGTVYPQVTGNDALTTYMNSPASIVAAQQRNSGSNLQFQPQHYFVLRAQEGLHDFHPDLTALTKEQKGTVIWGYDGKYPGPTFVSHYGEPILVRIVNDLFFDGNRRTPDRKLPGNFGNAQISTHLHNGHTGSESDGNPTDFYPPDPVPGHLPPYPDSIQNLRFRDHHYAMFRAGLDPRSAATKNDGDPAESLSTLWYHDHAMDHTAENVYAGLVGFHLLFDEVDSGNEKDPNPKSLRLPSDEFDIPLLIQDKRFDASGQLVLPDPTFDDCKNSKCFRLGILGDRFVVNGKIQPRHEVSRRKYRFRLLNAGPSRFYQLFLTKNDQDQAFVQIGNDESLLEAPLDVPADKGILISVSERVDIIIDFSKFDLNDKVFLVNRLVMVDEGFGPKPGAMAGTYETLPPGQGDKILRFDVMSDAPATSPGPATLPAKLRDNPKLPVEVDNVPPDQLKLLPNHRMFDFGLQTDDGVQPKWLINGVEFDPSPIGSPKAPDGTRRPVACHTTPDGKLSPLAACPTMPRSGLPGEPTMHDGEVWTIKNTGGWAHPVHIHLEEFQILWRNGAKPPLGERSKKDVLRLDPNEEVQIFLRFRDFYGKYPIHCHNVLHEDHEMMLRFDVVGDS